jgi:cobalt/nickel transport system permease protein
MWSDEELRRKSWLLAVSLGWLIAIAAVPQESWPLLGVFGAVGWMLHAVQGTSWAVLLRRQAQLLPLPLCLAVGVLGVGWNADLFVWLVVVSLRCSVAVLIAQWLSDQLTAGQLVAILRRWRLPAELIDVVAHLLRYLAVLWDEQQRMQRAHRARGGDGGSRWQQAKLATTRLAHLLFRSVDRAERIHRAMLARGAAGAVVASASAQSADGDDGCRRVASHGPNAVVHLVPDRCLP